VRSPRRPVRRFVSPRSFAADTSLRPSQFGLRSTTHSPLCRTPVPGLHFSGHRKTLRVWLATAACLLRRTILGPSSNTWKDKTAHHRDVRDGRARGTHLSFTTCCRGPHRPRSSMLSPAFQSLMALHITPRAGCAMTIPSIFTTGAESARQHDARTGRQVLRAKSRRGRLQGPAAERSARSRCRDGISKPNSQ